MDSGSRFGVEDIVAIGVRIWGPQPVALPCAHDALHMPVIVRFAAHRAPKLGYARAYRCALRAPAHAHRERTATIHGAGSLACVMLQGLVMLDSQTAEGLIKPHMPVVGSNNTQFAVVDHLEGRDLIKLTKDATGQHHYIPLTWVTAVDDKVHVDRPGAQAMREWSTTPTPPNPKPHKA